MEKIYEMIQDAEMFLIGIGEEFSPKYQPQQRCEIKNNTNSENCGIKNNTNSEHSKIVYSEEAEKNEIEDSAEAAALEEYRKSQFYAQLPEEHEVIQAYNKLRELIGAKPYFVVTMNTDDLVYRSKLEKDLIVAPCGSMQKLQCSEHIVDAAEIRGAVLQAADGGAGTKALQYAKCPVCKMPLSFHTIETEGYLEEGYLPQWSHYTKWLSCTLNRKLCVLELGVGFRFPQVIRFPFEKAAAYNQKACLIRVNSKFPQLPEEIAQRGVSVRKTPVEFFKLLK